MRRTTQQRENDMAAYFIVDQLEVTDPDTMKTYAAGVADTVRQYGGKMIVRGGAFEVTEGGWTPKRVIVLEFRDMATLKSWYDSPEYTPLREMRLASSRSNAIMVEGV
jgi:uncharacterized protein (DUF1330 family)